MSDGKEVKKSILDKLLKAKDTEPILVSPEEMDRLAVAQMKVHIADVSDLYSSGEGDDFWITASDHDRRMVKNSQLQREAYDAIRERDKQIAELRAEVAKAETTIASQEEAIENIRQQVRAMHFDIELAAIERAEGEKEHE